MQQETEAQPQRKIDWKTINDDEPKQGYKGHNKTKPKMQTRGEIDRLIDDCQDTEILLNIVKCHFDATAEDVTKAFPNFDFVKVENYNPGSFSLIFKSKEIAKEFLFTTKESRILGRGFWIKFPVRFQKSTHKLQDNPNHDNQLPPQGHKFNDAPSKHDDNYNRKQSGDQEGAPQQLAFYRSDNKTGQQQKVVQAQNQNQQKYQSRKQKNEDDDEGWQTVLPPNFNKKYNHYHNNRQPRQHQQDK